MKCLKDFEKELNKCSKCGLCESSCPLFKINPNDCVASKGKFIMLHGVVKGDLELSANINKYLDLCLKCGRCNHFCPSSIDVCEIVNTAKHDYVINKPSLIRFLQSPVIFDNIIKIGKILSKPFRSPKRKPETGVKVLYFKGCINQIFPQTDKYIRKIFQNRFEIAEPDFKCCGLPFLSEGNFERFSEVAQHNIKQFECDFDYIVTDCASCEYTLMEYPKYIEDCYDISPAKFVNWGEIIADKNLKFKFKKHLKVTFHKPCHLKDDSFFEKIISNCKNVQYIKADDYDDCCGFAGGFALKNPEISAKLTMQKAKKIEKTGADYLITTCPSCIIGLKQGLRQINSKIKVVSLLEFLARSK